MDAAVDAHGRATGGETEIQARGAVPERAAYWRSAGSRWSSSIEVFEANWNDGHQYITSAFVSANTLQYSWDPKFAGLYGLRADADRSSLRVPTWSSSPTCTSSRRASGSWRCWPRPDTSTPIPGEQRGEVPFFALKVDFTYDGSREADLPGPWTSVTLPTRCGSSCGSSWCRGVAAASASSRESRHRCLDMLDVTTRSSLEGGGSIHDVNVKQWITDKIERAIVPTSDGRGGQAFDPSIRPWLVGHYDVERIYYDRRRRDGHRLRGRAPVKSMLEDLQRADEHEDPHAAVSSTVRHTRRAASRRRRRTVPHETSVNPRPRARSRRSTTSSC